MKTITKQDLLERLKIGQSGRLVFDCQLSPRIESEKCIFGTCDKCCGLLKDLNPKVPYNSNVVLKAIKDSKNEVFTLEQFNELKKL